MPVGDGNSYAHTPKSMDTTRTRVLDYELVVLVHNIIYMYIYIYYTRESRLLLGIRVVVCILLYYS